MKIEVKENGSKEFYQEFVNILMQGKKLQKNPEAPLADNFKSFKSTGIAGAVFLVLCMFCGFAFGWSKLLMISTAVLWVAMLMLFVYLNKMNKTVTANLEDKRPSIITLNERGVSISKDGSPIVRLTWDQVAFVRTFKESTCFVPKDSENYAIAVNNAHLAEIREFMDNNETGVRAIW